MDSANWASAESVAEQQRKAVSRRAEALLRRALEGSELYSTTSSVICPECGGRRAKFKHLGTDMKDWHGRKNEVWGTQNHDDEGHDCEIVCSSCENTWRGTAPEEDDPLDDSDEFEDARRKDLVLQPGLGTVHKRD